MMTRTSTLRARRVLAVALLLVLAPIALIAPRFFFAADAASITLEAESGFINGPFVVADGAISQSVKTEDPLQGGQAIYTFDVSAPGEYAVVGVVNAPNDDADSFFVNIDAEPDASMAWDIALTSGFSESTASWRGNGTPEAAEFAPKLWNLAAGQHQLMIRGREAGALLDRVSIVPINVTEPTPLPPTDIPVPTTDPALAAPAAEAPVPTADPALLAPTPTIEAVPVPSGEQVEVPASDPAHVDGASPAPANVGGVAEIPAAPASEPQPTSDVAAAALPLSFEAEGGQITTPYAAVNGFVAQSIDTGLSRGGRAVYTFQVPTDGDYIVKILAHAPDGYSNSAFVNIDAEPSGDSMVWDVPTSSGFQERAVTWRKDGSVDLRNRPAQVFRLAAGQHTLVVRGREKNTRLDRITIVAANDATAAPQEPVAPTAVPPTAVPPTAVPPTAVPPTAVPPTAVPPTAVPPTAVPPTAVPQATTAPQTASTTFEAEGGQITTPYAAVNGFVAQSIDTGLSRGGRAVYTFQVPTDGDYIVKILAHAPDGYSNSAFVNIDAEPSGDSMVWDVPTSSGFQERAVTWRKDGSVDLRNRPAQVFRLAAGQHTLVVRGREKNTRLDRITIVSTSAVTSSPQQPVPTAAAPAPTSVAPTTSPVVPPSTGGTLSGPPPASGKRFTTLAPGSSLPSGADCAQRIRRTTWEPQPKNTTANRTVATGYSLQAWGGVSSAGNAYLTRVKGNLASYLPNPTTDEILQWGACVWGIDEDIVRAQAIKESTMSQAKRGDYNDRNGDGVKQPESFGIMQVRTGSSEGGASWRGLNNAEKTSTAFNVDYTYARWRACYDGHISYMAENGDPAGYRTDSANERLWGCVGAWFTGQYQRGTETNYVNEVKSFLSNRPWENPNTFPSSR